MILKPEQREYDPPYRAAIARLPCFACLCKGKFKRGVHVAHVRAVSQEHGKPYTAKGRKPSDRWTLPLCPPHHTGDVSRIKVSQHSMDEIDFWSALGVHDVFQVCLDLSAAYDQGLAMGPVLALAASEATKARHA